MNAPDDRELERYLQGGDSLSRAYAEFKSERPTPALDQAVLAKAKAALRPQPHAHGRRYFGWPALTAIAATVLLSFALVMRVVLESEMPQESPLTSPAASAPGAVDAPAPAALEDYAPASAESEPAFAPPPASPVGKSSIETRRQVIEAEIREAAEAAPAVDVPDAQAGAASSLEANRAPAPPPEADVARVSASPVLERARDEVEESASMQGIASPSEASYGLRPMDAKAKKEQIKPPQEWLAEIEQLRASGESEAADRELERFKQAYPGYLESQASPADK